jgi:CRP-like cAMP-binding protein
MDPAPPHDPELDFGAPAPQQFLTAEQLGAWVLQCLEADSLDEAASLIATSSPEVGDALLGLQNLSPEALNRLAEAFFRARDDDRALLAARRLGNPERAALFLERGGQFQRAAELRERLGQTAQAADLYLRGGAPERAAALFTKLGQIEQAADAFERAGKFYEAGRLWSRQRRLDRALAVLQKVTPGDESFVPATLLLGRILEFTGHPAAAIARYQDVVQSRPLDATTIDIHERLIGLHIQADNVADARRLIAKVLKFEPNRPYPVRALGMLLGKGSTEATMRSEVSLPPLAPAESRVFSSQQPHTITAIHPAVDQLRQLPLFQELALSEIRALHDAGEVARYQAGEILIEQDQEGTFFFVLFSGAVQVLRFQGPGRVGVPLAELRYGACVGEMALLDEGPTSAQVRALVDTTTFRWPLPRLRALLAANERTALRILRVMSRALSVRLRETSRHVHEGAGAVTIRLQSPHARPGGAACGSRISRWSAPCFLSVHPRGTLHATSSYRLCPRPRPDAPRPTRFGGLQPLRQHRADLHHELQVRGLRRLQGQVYAPVAPRLLRRPVQLLRGDQVHRLLSGGLRGQVQRGSAQVQLHRRVHR